MRAAWTVGVLVPAAVAALALLAGCGGDGEDELTVLAAASLTDVLPIVDPDPAYSFAASDTLATQVREGVPADVYAAANERLPDELFAEGLVERPVTFATNRLVLLVPAGNPAEIDSVADLRRQGVVYVLADAGVPVGDYTREVLFDLGASALVEGAASFEDDVRAVTGKVALGEADAGFAYATDAAAVSERVEVVELPDEAQAPIAYGVAVVAGSDRREAAEAFVARLRGPQGREALRAAGFGLP